jgi:Ca2+-binding EF-hand superfamily protein
MIKNFDFDKDGVIGIEDFKRISICKNQSEGDDIFQPVL